MIVSMPTCLSCGATDTAGIPKDKKDGVLFLKPSPWLCPECRNTIASMKTIHGRSLISDAIASGQIGIRLDAKVPHT